MTDSITSALQQPPFWVSVLALLVALLSAANAWKARKIAERSLALNESQEQRRRPRFIIYMVQGYRRYLPDKQLFGFLVSVSNPTDINNSIAQAELKITYLIKDEVKAVFRIPRMPQFAEPVHKEPIQGANVLALPIRVDAHQTVAGWLVFSLDSKIIAGRTVDSHRIVLEDSHGDCSETEPIIVSEWTDELPKETKEEDGGNHH